MFKIIDSKDVITSDDAENQYRNCVILMLDQTAYTGRVYAISDWQDVNKLMDLQEEFINNGVRASVNSNVASSNSTLINVGCELL